MICTWSEPRKRKLESTASRAPLPSARVVMTEATPMMTPKAVSAERRVLAAIPFSAVSRVLLSDISHLLCQHQPIAHMDDAAGITGAVRIVGDHEQGMAL